MSLQSKIAARVASAHGNTEIEASSPSRSQTLHSASAIRGQEAGQLPAGCVWGIPTYTGTPSQLVEDDRSAVDGSILLSIQDDNYKYLRYMIMKGWTPTPVQSCGFDMRIRQGGRDKVWTIANGTPLQYALCCGKFKTAAGFLVAFPDQLDLRCTVLVDGVTTTWSALDIALFFERHFREVSPSRAADYERAANILRQTVRGIPFNSLATAGERIREVVDAEDAIAALQPVQPHSHVQ